MTNNNELQLKIIEAIKLVIEDFEGDATYDVTTFVDKSMFKKTACKETVLTIRLIEQV